ncbi:biotin-dependent carboxyltransferase family protein [Alkalihalobacterium sp. APHAB7]|uniref:5-oxoprolinase subunit C family protein n=1 Tax=Alkalihalobacterium sp. APHAB7 TaxID=3402081 RepID=UPI003AB023F7
MVWLCQESKSTYVRGNLGGFKGRVLQKGDVLYVRRETPCNRTSLIKSLHPSLIPNYKEKHVIRVMKGPEWHSFIPESQETFFNKEFTVGHQSDRMGYRLKGSSLSHKNSADILSDVIAYGTIQVPKSGEPIIMMADRQTTGGYKRIAPIIE